MHRCRRLKKYARRAGRYLRYRESDLEKFEMEGNFMRHWDEPWPDEAKKPKSEATEPEGFAMSSYRNGVDSMSHKSHYLHTLTAIKNGYNIIKNSGGRQGFLTYIDGRSILTTFARSGASSFVPNH